MVGERGKPIAKEGIDRELIKSSTGLAPTDPKYAKSSTESASGHRIIRFNNESIGAAFGRAPHGRGAPLWMLSLLNLMILCPDVDPVEEFAHFGSVGAILWMIR